MRVAVVTVITLGMLFRFSAAASDILTQKVDQIFSVYDKPGSPGCSLGVIHDGDFAYRKAYGSANLELGVPLSPQSVFYMGSVSKQFTAASVVLAAEQGLLSLDASFKSDGAVPLAMSCFVADHLRSAAIEAGVKIEKGQRFGLHNLRHSLSHWLVNKGKVEPKTVQSMLRHSKIQTTLDLYTQGDSDEMSTAQQLFADAVDWCGLEKPTQVM